MLLLLPLPCEICKVFVVHVREELQASEPLQDFAVLLEVGEGQRPIVVEVERVEDAYRTMSAKRDMRL